MKVRIDQSRDLVEVLNPLTGKIEKGELVKSLTETDPIDTKLQDQIGKLKEENKVLTKKVAFFEKNITTLSADAWSEYQGL